jgi:hypothetical protein
MVAPAFDVIGAVASILQLIQFTCSVVERVNEFRSNAKELPKAFRQFSQELPVLQATLKRLQEAIEEGLIPETAQQSLSPTLEGCRDQIQLLNQILNKTLPSEGDSSTDKAYKALISLTKDSKVEKTMTSIRSYLGTLTSYFVISSSLPTISSGKFINSNSSLVAKVSQTKSSQMFATGYLHLIPLTISIEPLNYDKLVLATGFWKAPASLSGEQKMPLIGGYLDLQDLVNQSSALALSTLFMVFAKEMLTKL